MTLHPSHNPRGVIQKGRLSHAGLPTQNERAALSSAHRAQQLIEPRTFAGAATKHWSRDPREGYQSGHSGSGRPTRFSFSPCLRGARALSFRLASDLDATHCRPPSSQSPISRRRANATPGVRESNPPPDRRRVVHHRLTALQERDLVIAAERGDSEACRKLVEAFLPAIGGLARSFKHSRVERVELLQEGVAGLLVAARRYDTHARYTVLGVRLVLGPQSDAGARRRTDTAGGTLGSRRPRARTDQKGTQRTPPDARRRTHHSASSAVRPA